MDRGSNDLLQERNTALKTDIAPQIPAQAEVSVELGEAGPSSRAAWLRRRRSTASAAVPVGPLEASAALSPNVTLGPFSLADRTYAVLVGDLVAGAAAASTSDRPFIAYALHVGGLNARQDKQFVVAMSGADTVYADGASVLLLAKLANGRHVQRAATTDLAWDVLREMNVALGRPTRVALVGGAEGLAQRAGVVLASEAGVEIVGCEHGFHQDWSPVLAKVAASEADIVIVGLGAPREMKWVEQHRDELPSCLIMTCGGWFGFVVKDETRAPAYLQKAGLEWSYRLMQAPSRLASRYSVGLWTTLRFAASLTLHRLGDALI